MRRPQRLREVTGQQCSFNDAVEIGAAEELWRFKQECPYSVLIRVSSHFFSLLWNFNNWIALLEVIFVPLFLLLLSLLIVCRLSAGPARSRGSCVLGMRPDVGGVRRRRCFTSSPAHCRSPAESPPTWTKPPSWESPSASCGCTASSGTVRSSSPDGRYRCEPATSRREGSNSWRRAEQQETAKH